MHRPRPTVTEDTAFYWDGAARDELLLQRCDACSLVRHPPVVACPRCRSLAWSTTPAGGRGVVHAFVVLHPPLVPGVAEGTVVAVVQLDEGPRVVTNVVDASSGTVEIGAAVEVCFEDLGDGLKLPQFRLALPGGPRGA